MKIFAIIITFMLVVVMLITLNASADETIRINQIDSVISIDSGEEASYQFEVINSGTLDKTIEITYDTVSGFSIDIFPANNFEVPAGNTVDVYINITPSSRSTPTSMPFRFNFNNVNDRTIVDTIELTLIISIDLGVEIDYVTNGGENDVFIDDPRGTEYLVQVRNLGNTADTYSFAISDMQLLDRVTATLGNWSVVTHEFSDWVPIGGDEINEISIPEYDTGLFYVTVITTEDVRVGEKLRFNLTITSQSNSTVLDTYQFTTTATLDAYEVDLILLNPSNTSAINPNSEVTFDFRVVGADLVDETVRINVIVQEKWGDAGFIFYVYDEDGDLKGGFWKDAVNYEHPFDVAIPKDSVANYTVKILSPSAFNASSNTNVHFSIVGSVVESMSNRSIGHNQITTSRLFESPKPDTIFDNPFFLWGMVGIVITLLGALGYASIKK